MPGNTGLVSLALKSSKTSFTPHHTITGKGIAYISLVQINSSERFLLDQYLYDGVTPVTLSPKLLAYDKPIDPTEMPCISTCIEMTTEDMNIPTQDDKYPWLDHDDK